MLNYKSVRIYIIVTELNILPQSQEVKKKQNKNYRQK